MCLALVLSKTKRRNIQLLPVLPVLLTACRTFGIKHRVCQLGRFFDIFIYFVVLYVHFIFIFVLCLILAALWQAAHGKQYDVFRHGMTVCYTFFVIFCIFWHDFDNVLISTTNGFFAR